MQTITPTQHDKLEWARLAQAAYGAGSNAVGHRFSNYASWSAGTQMPVDLFDREARMQLERFAERSLVRLCVLRPASR